MTINPKLLDEVLAEYKKPEDMIGENGLLKQLTKALLERAMQALCRQHVELKTSARRICSRFLTLLGLGGSWNCGDAHCDEGNERGGR